MVEREANTLPVTCPCFRAEGRGLSDLETRVRFSPALPDSAVRLERVAASRLSSQPTLDAVTETRGRGHHSSARAPPTRASPSPHHCLHCIHAVRADGRGLPVPRVQLPPRPRHQPHHRLEWVAASRLSISRKSGHLAISGQVPSALTHPLEHRSHRAQLLEQRTSFSSTRARLAGGYSRNGRVPRKPLPALRPCSVGRRSRVNGPAGSTPASPTS